MPDTHDFLRLVAMHQASVWRYLQMLGCEPHEAEDLTQETFVSVYARPFEYQGEAQAAAYLRKAAYHFYLKSLRSRERAAGDSFENAEATWAAFVPREDSGEWLEALRHCVETIEERERQAVKLRYFENQGIGAIASSLQTTEDGIKSLLTRAKNKLRDCVKKRIKL